MTDFNWTAYARWENQQESQNEDHNEDCDCYLCNGYALSHMRDEEKIERWECDHESGKF